jgi:hypothetical protein
MSGEKHKKKKKNKKILTRSGLSYMTFPICDGRLAGYCAYNAVHWHYIRQLEC